MGQLTDAGANLVLDSGLPATVYQGLSSTTPNVNGTGVTEPSGNGYAREAVTLGAASGRQRSNTNATNFAAAGGDWGVMTYSVFYTASSGGTFISFDDLDSNRNMVDGAETDFAVGAIDFPA